jgi:predicted RNA-binding protein with PIN domain
MTYLIDGYNLLHAMGVISGRLGPGGLEKARLRLLGLLRGGYGEETAKVTVVFDAHGAPAGADGEQDYHGIQVRFAIGKAEADELIEELIQHDSAPRRLTVVSDDHRIQQAARRRHCSVMGCGDYLDWLDRHRRQRKQRPAESSAKPDAVSEAEAERWLREFGESADEVP